MNEIIDISVKLNHATPVWPDSAGFRTVKTMSLENGDPANVTRLDCDVHVGTHIDAPRHYYHNGRTVDKLSLNVLIGPAIVVDFPQAKLITASLLNRLHLPLDTRRLLLRTGNSSMWLENTFNSYYTALAADAAQWIVDHNIGLVGIDYLSVEPYGNKPEVHTILLDAGVVIIEGLNLAHAAAGFYELICLPMYITEAEAAPARAVLRVMPEARAI
jgi:arylformamidase